MCVCFIILFYFIFSEIFKRYVTDMPIEVYELLFMLQISCGGTHSVALTRDGRMFSVSVVTFFIQFHKLS